MTLSKACARGQPDQRDLALRNLKLDVNYKLPIRQAGTLVTTAFDLNILNLFKVL